MAKARWISATLNGTYRWVWVSSVATQALSLPTVAAIATVIATVFPVTWWQWRRAATAAQWTVEQAQDALIVWGFLITAGLLALTFLFAGPWWIPAAGAIAITGISAVTALHPRVARWQATYLRRTQPTN